MTSAGTGYQNGRTSYAADLDGTSQPVATFFDSVNEQIWSQEINLISPASGPFTWVVGASYQHNTYDFPYGRYDIGIPPGGFDITIAGVNPEQSIGEFAQLSFNLPAGLQAQLGGRYSQFKTTNRIFEGFPQLGVTLPDFQTLTENKATGKAALNWTINHDNFVYAFVSTGVKPGGLNVPATVTLTAPFREETVTAYETGWKAAFLADHLRTQLSAYYNDYNNFQVTVSQPDAPTLQFELNDPSKTTIYGIEAESQAGFGDFSFDFGASLLHSRLGAFYASDYRIPATSGCNPRTGPVGNGCVNLDGLEQDYAPKFTLNVGGQYVFHVNQGATLTPRMNFGHIAQQWATLFENTEMGDRLGARNLLSAQLAYEKGGWIATAYGANLADQHYVSSIIAGLRFAGSPRQFGVRLAKTF
jgi:iron complex outermembrane recepter protein